MANIITFESKEKMLASQESTGDRFEQLLAGLNRIRFIQKRQASNHTKMAHHLSQIINRFSHQKPPLRCPGQRLSAQRGKWGEGATSEGPGAEGCGVLRGSTSRQKFKIPAVRSKYALQTTQEDSSLLKTTHDFEDSLPHNAQVEAAGQSGRLKEVLEEKCANYRLMKEREQEMDLIRRLRSEESQRVLRQRVAQAAARREEGRRKVQGDYFGRIEKVQAEKDIQRARKDKIAQKKMRQMVRLQLEQRSQIEQFESSLALQEHLKSFLKERLPLNPSALALPKHSFQC